MGMTIEELRDYVDQQRALNNIPYHVYSTLIDELDLMADTMHKYQKIEKIYSDYLKYMNPDNLVDRLGEVLEDGSENNHNAPNT